MATEHAQFEDFTITAINMGRAEELSQLKGALQRFLEAGGGLEAAEGELEDLLQRARKLNHQIHGPLIMPITASRKEKDQFLWRMHLSIDYDDCRNPPPHQRPTQSEITEFIERACTEGHAKTVSRLIKTAQAYEEALDEQDYDRCLECTESFVPMLQSLELALGLSIYREAEVEFNHSRGVFMSAWLTAVFALG